MGSVVAKNGVKNATIEIVKITADGKRIPCGTIKTDAESIKNDNAIKALLKKIMGGE